MLDLLIMLAIIGGEMLLYFLGMVMSAWLDREMYSQWSGVPLLFVNSIALIYMLLIM